MRFIIFVVIALEPELKIAALSPFAWLPFSMSQAGRGKVSRVFERAGGEPCAHGCSCCPDLGDGEVKRINISMEPTSAWLK
jgi:hypothetical protein